MRILGFGTYNIAAHPRVGILLEGLRDRGHTVDELNEPLRVSTEGRVAALSSPSAALTFFGRLAKNWVRLIAGTRRHRGSRRPDAVLVGYLGHFDVLLARILYPRTTIILDHLIYAADTAADRGAKGGVLNRILTGLDRLAITAADIVVYDTTAHADLAPAPLQHKGVVVPVGAPDAWFEARQEHPISGVVFYGLYTPLQGTPTIARALRILADSGDLPPVTMIGTGQDYEEVREIVGDADITWIDWAESTELPAIVASHAIGLGIFGTTDKAQRVVPNKVYQSMAAGCATITSDTAPQRAMLGDAATYVPAGDPAALADAIRTLVNDDARREEMRGRAFDLASRSFTHSAVITPLEERLS